MKLQCQRCRRTATHWVWWQLDGEWVKARVCRKDLKIAKGLRPDLGSRPLRPNER